MATPRVAPPPATRCRALLEEAPPAPLMQGVGLVGTSPHPTATHPSACESPAPAAPTDAGAGTSSEAAPNVPAAAPAPSSSSSSRGPAAFNDSVPEQLFYEGSASNAELLINLLLAFTLVYIPITIAVVGKRLWIKYRFTNKRVQVINSSPLFARQVRQDGPQAPAWQAASQPAWQWGAAS